ncbi:MAG: 2-oxoacid:acceptor oxidoreductase family protein [Candidatus Omnitrophica bacterium]|nr:2-oxoacid:acceptor oxidoreductase family protein [Candidatus Omnitrophota bacterium]
MKTDILISGFGGQGLMSLGKILARAATCEGKHTIFFPSYGAEMRGGTAHCLVKISDLSIASPFMDSPDVAIIFNQPSLDKFRSEFRQNSLVILNSDLIPKINLKTGIKTIALPLNEMALECGNIKVANIIVLGVLSALKPKLLARKTIISILEETFSKKGSFEVNLKAFKLGERFNKP